MADKELENLIEKKKRYIADYIRHAPLIGIPQETIDKTVDMLLGDLSDLLKEKEQ